MKKDISIVYFVYERNIATVELIRESFISIFKGAENVELNFRQHKKLTKYDIDRSDVLVMIRPHNILSRAIAEKSKKAGCFVITFIDDDLLNLPSNIHSIPWRISALKNVISISDMLLTPNQYILNKYKDSTHGKRGAVINFVMQNIKLEKDILRRRNSGTIKLVYAAGKHHSDSIKKYIYPVLKYIDKNCTKNISMEFIGVKPDFDIKDISFDVNYIDFMPLKEYRNWMAEQKYDIGFAPLDNTPFNNKKYFIKYLEYTANGIVGIYSNCAPYTFAIRDGYNGFLADDNDWINKTILAIENCDLRHNILLNAQKDLQEKYTAAITLDNIKRNIPEFFSKRKVKINCKNFLFDKLLYVFSLYFDSLYLIFFYIKREGIKKMFKRAIDHFKFFN